MVSMFNLEIPFRQLQYIPNYSHNWHLSLEHAHHTAQDRWREIELVASDRGCNLLDIDQPSRLSKIYMLNHFKQLLLASSKNSPFAPNGLIHPPPTTIHVDFDRFWSSLAMLESSTMAPSAMTTMTEMEETFEDAATEVGTDVDAPPPDEQKHPNIESTYHFLKHSSRDYQRVKVALFSAMAKQGLGTWVPAPVDTDLFSI